MECSERLEDARFFRMLCRIDAEQHRWVNELICYLSLILEQSYLLPAVYRPLLKKSPLIRNNAATLLIIAVIYSHILCEVFHSSQCRVDLHAELPIMSWREIAGVCYIRYGRKPEHKSVKHIATSGPLPSLQARRYQPLHLIPDLAERKLAVIRLHSEGWSITSIAE